MLKKILQHLLSTKKDKYQVLKYTRTPVKIQRGLAEIDSWIVTELLEYSGRFGWRYRKVRQKIPYNLRPVYQGEYESNRNLARIAGVAKKLYNAEITN